MLNIKLIDVLKTLNKKEFRKFSEMVASPFYNKSAAIVRLFEALSKYYPEFNNRNLSLEKLFEKVFSEEKYDYHKINNVISDLYALSEKFFIVISLDENPNTEKRFLISQFRNRRLDKLYMQKHLAFKEYLENEINKDEELYYAQHKMYEDYSQFLSITEPNTGHKLLQDAFDPYLFSVLTKLLRYYNLMMHEQRQNKFEYNMRMFDEVLGYLDKNEIDEPPILSVHKNIIQLEKTNNKKYYDELERLRKLYHEHLTQRDLQLLYIHMFGFVAHNLNTVGDYSYYKDAFRLNRDVIERKVMDKDSMKYPDFLNIVKTACAAGEYLWAVKFIDEFKSTLPADEYDNSLNFSYGTIEQRKGNMQAALKYFSKTNFSNFLMKVQVKIIQCKLHFEMNAYEQTLSAIDSFRHYVLREKMIIDEHKEAYYTFLKYLTQLIKIKELQKPSVIEVELAVLKKEVKNMNSNPFGVKVWLLDQIGLGRE